MRVTDCRAEDGCQEVVRFKTKMDRGGIVEDIVYENITADGIASVFTFNMNALAKTWLPEEFRTRVPPEQGTPVFRNITIRNLKATNCKSAGRLAGLPQSPLHDIRLENVSIEAEDGFTIQHATGVRFTNVKLNGELVPSPLDSGSGITARVDDGAAVR